MAAAKLGRDKMVMYVAYFEASPVSECFLADS